PRESAATARRASHWGSTGVPVDPIIAQSGRLRTDQAAPTRSAGPAGREEVLGCPAAFGKLKPVPPNARPLTMKLLLTNDDGIDAPGLEALYEAARQFGEPVVVAPVDAHSGCSHRVTTDCAIRVSERGPNLYAVDGTPADCVRVALHSVVPDAAWVLSGINAGGNLGADVWHSGTVAAVREAVLHGRPGVALSQYHNKKDRPIDWKRGAAWVLPLLRRLTQQ